ncbi:MAG: magnesium/cobalt transporter CorA [Candidatus Woesearchaeota archaeon]
MSYNDKKVTEKKLNKVEESLSHITNGNVVWININGISNPEVIESIGKQFNLHPLLLEDITHTDQRPKIDDYGDYIFIIIKMIYPDEGIDLVRDEQISIILGKNFLISFQESEGDVFDPIRQRIRSIKSRINKNGPDYLAYSLLDAIVDSYFLVFERLGERIEEIEEKILAVSSSETTQEMHRLKRKTISLRKSIWPLREVISSLERSGSPLIKKNTLIYLRDVYDHTIQVIDRVETSRDILASMMDVYLTNASNKLNEVMKVLTIIGTIFIPLIFITGLYGMNFEFFPELSWKYSYFTILGVMLLISLGMILYFKRKKWI